MKNDKLPNFLVVGAPRSGTTTIYENLNRHPQVYLNHRIKETNFFIEPKEVLGNGPRYFGHDSYGSSIRRYMLLFQNARSCHKAIGEICPTYLPFYEYAIPNIKRYLGRNIKIVIILRNPIDRAFSHYLLNVRDLDEVESFEAALKLEDDRMRKGYWHSFYLTKLGMYYKQVKAYLDTFYAVKIFLFEDLQDDKLFDPLSLFLDIDKIPTVSKKKFNMAGRPRNRLLQNILVNEKAVKRAAKYILGPFLSEQNKKALIYRIQKLNLKREVMHDNTRKALTNIFRDDIDKLSNIIDRDVSHWLNEGIPMGCKN